MSPSVKNELLSPTFLLALCSFLLAVCGGVYTLGIQNQKIEAGALKNGEQDVKLEKLSDKMDAGFQRMSDKIDALRVELKSR